MGDTPLTDIILATAREGNTALVSSLIQENTTLDYCYYRGDSFLETLKESDCLDWPSPESHQNLRNDDFFYDLECKLYEAMRPVFIPLQFLRQ